MSPDELDECYRRIIDRNLDSALRNVKLAIALVCVAIVLIVVRLWQEHRGLDKPRPAPAQRVAP